MATTKESIDIRKRLSIELCNNFIKRLNLHQSKETKIGAIIAIKNFIKESQIDDPFLFSYLVDTILDPDKEVKHMVIKVIKDVSTVSGAKKEITELLEIKSQESNGEIKKEIAELLNYLTLN